MPESVAPTLTYTRILQAPRELVFRCMLDPISAIVALDAHRTQVTIEQRNAPAPFHDPQARAGFATSLDRFEAYTTTLHSAGAA